MTIKIKNSPAKKTFGSEITPMMAQYLKIKSDNRGSLLFYRMGDFYELFFSDAEKASVALGITLTHRGKHDGKPVPMCGVPVRSADLYLERLIRSGFHVAVCEQTEDPKVAKARGYKSIVSREVQRLVTPGTLTEENLLDMRSANYLIAVSYESSNLGIAWSDISTGEFSSTTCDLFLLGALLVRLNPKEVLLPEDIFNEEDLRDVLVDWENIISYQPTRLFDITAAKDRLTNLYGVAALDGFGTFTSVELSAAGAIVEYIKITQKGKLPRLEVLNSILEKSSMIIDASTRKNLELTRSVSGTDEDTLLSVIDRTITGPGARLLSSRLVAPLTKSVDISDRLDQVEFFFSAHIVREGLRQILRKFPDIERILSRITLGRGGPRDIAALAAGLALVPKIRATLNEDAILNKPGAAIQQISNQLGEHENLSVALGGALKSDLPLTIREGGFITEGYNTVLDELVSLRDESRKLVATLQLKYRSATGVESLKIKHNKILGYFVDVTERNSTKLGDMFIHRQTLKAVMRFTTVELGDLENKITTAAQKALELEIELFDQLLQKILPNIEDIAQLAKAVANFDVASALAELAIEKSYVRPIVDNSMAFDIKGGRHPVVESSIDIRNRFVANDCCLDPDKFLWLITGPNMAGKSTFLRQNALIAILAQMGSFVPADNARIGIIDHLFSRVGASDDLAHGRSTFMVEMIETAAILNLSGPRALVILDEIGRGTATFDGLSIAWATVEHIHEINKCRTLFATHYHELTELETKLENLSCSTMRVKEWKENVVFLHEVIPGSADQSYGIHVAGLAGFPVSVLSRAKNILNELESTQQGKPDHILENALPLFSNRKSESFKMRNKQDENIRAAILEVDPDSLSPKAALDLVYRLSTLIKKG